MNHQQQMDHNQVKEEYSQVFTLKSIKSQEEILQFIPVYNRHSQSTQLRSGHWSIKEHIKYVMFIDYFEHIFTVKHNIKLWKIFTIMSEFIKTRNSSQCRSHHQKTQRKHASIEEILRIQRAKYKNYHSQFQKMKETLAKLPIQNPVEVQPENGNLYPLPSLKILEQDVPYPAPLLRNSISLGDMIELDRSQASKKYIRSQKAINIPREKYIASQVSIQMEHQNQHDAFSQQRIKQIIFEELDYDKEKPSWLFNHSQADNLSKKDQKFDRTADSLFNDTKNNKCESQQKPKHDSLPQKQSQNQQKNQIQEEQIYKKSNLVQKKRSRTRSVLASYEIVENQGNSKRSQFYRESKKDKLYTADGKCKTLPPQTPRSTKDQEDQSQSIQKVLTNRPVGKSIFSGFVSSIDSGNKEQDYEHEQQHDQKMQGDYGNQKQNNQEDESVKNNFKMKIKDYEEGYFQIQPHVNLLYCDYGFKGNFINQIQQSKEDGQNSSPFIFLPQKKPSKKQQQYEDNQQIEDRKPKMNFTKKSTQQIDKGLSRNSIENDFIVKVEQQNILQQNNINQRNLVQQHQDNLGYFQHHYDSTMQQFYPYQSFYSPYLMTPQYSILYQNYQNFILFYIYYLMQSINFAEGFFDHSNNPN